MKRVILVGLLIIISTVITACSNNEDKDTLLDVCNNVYEIIDEYEASNIEKSSFIDKIKALSEDCTDDSAYICTEISTFNNISPTISDDIINAHITQLRNCCQMVEDNQ